MCRSAHHFVGTPGNQLRHNSQLEAGIPASCVQNCGHSRDRCEFSRTASNYTGASITSKTVFCGQGQYRNSYIDFQLPQRHFRRMKSEFRLHQLQILHEFPGALSI